MINASNKRICVEFWRFFFDDFSISLLGYRTEFSCLYLPQGHTFINTDEYEHFWFWKSIFNMLFISRYHMPDLKYKIKFTSLVSFCTNSEMLKRMYELVHWSTSTKISRKKTHPPVSLSPMINTSQQSLFTEFNCLCGCLLKLNIKRSSTVR